MELTSFTSFMFLFFALGIMMNSGSSGGLVRAGIYVFRRKRGDTDE